MHVRLRHARGQLDDVHDASRLGDQSRGHRLACRTHIPHVDAVDIHYAGQVRGRLRHPVCGFTQRTDQHRGHGQCHGADRQRDASTGQ